MLLHEGLINLELLQKILSWQHTGYRQNYRSPQTHFYPKLPPTSQRIQQELLMAVVYLFSRFIRL